MNIVLALFLILAFSLILAKSTDIVVRNIARLARKFSVPEFAIGFFILGFATSLPEIFIAINSIVDRTPELSLGNLLGATVVLLTLVIGIPAVVSGKVAIKQVLNTKDIILSSFVIALPAFFSLDGNLAKTDGLILLISYIGYVFMLNKDESFLEKLKIAAHKNKVGVLKLIGLILFGVFGVFISSRVVVEVSLELTTALLLPAIVTGIIFLSVGTDLPELSLAIRTVISKHKIVGVGDFLGSAAVNTFVVAILCLFSPFKIADLEAVRLASFFTISSVIILTTFMLTKKELTRKEGFILLLFFLVFISVEVCKNGLLG